MIRSSQANTAIRSMEPQNEPTRASSHSMVPLALDGAPAEDGGEPCDNEEPFMEGENVDTGNPALNEVLSELRNYNNEISEKQYKGSSPNPEDVAEAWNRLGLIRIHMQRNADEARKCHLRARNIYKRSSPQNHGIAMATTLKDLGLCYERLHQDRRALDTYREALDILKAQQLADENLHLIALYRAITRIAPNRF